MSDSPNADTPTGVLSTPALPAPFADTRVALHRLAFFVLAPMRRLHTGRIGLRPTLGGFGTPPFAADGAAVQVRIEATRLVLDREGITSVLDLAGGVSLVQAASFLGVAIDPGAAEGFDGPALGDAERPLELDARSIELIARWYELGSGFLATLRSAGADDAVPPSEPQIWPEHFDLALDLGDEGAGTRVNVGFSPGDAFSGEPYVYVGPWDRTVLEGGDPVWDAPFGATAGWSAVMATGAPHEHLSGLVARARAAVAAGAAGAAGADRSDR